MKIKIFEYLDYRDFLREMHLRMPLKGHGQLTKISQALNINPSIVTLVFKGSKNFTLEQANDLAEYLGFTELETDYLLASVNFARAGKTNLQTKYKQQLDKLKLQAKKVKERIPNHANIPDETKAVFYSQWYYSAIRLLSSIAEFDHVDGIASRLSLPRNKVKQTIDFLVLRPFNFCRFCT